MRTLTAVLTGLLSLAGLTPAGTIATCPADTVLVSDGAGNAICASWASVIDGNYNAVVSPQGLPNLTSSYPTGSYDNYAFGLRPLLQCTTCYNNAAFGVDSLGLTTSGYRNAGYGVDSCAWNTTGYENSCMGMNTLWSLIQGYDNAASGFNTLFGVSSGHYNSGLGAYADLFYPNTMAGTSLALTSGANLGVGYYWYKISYVFSWGESALSNNAYLGILTTPGNQAVAITGIPTYSGPFLVTARKIYRTMVCPATQCTSLTSNQAPRVWYYVGSINDNVTTAFTDTVVDANLGAQASGDPIDSLALGAYATIYQSNQAVIGSDAAPIKQIWLGNGVASVQGPNSVQVAATGASGTNVIGNSITYAAGPGTGSAAGGNYCLASWPSGSSGSTWNTLVSRWCVDPNTGDWIAQGGSNLPSIAMGGTMLNSSGGSIYNNSATGNTQIVMRASSSQAANGAGFLVFQNHAGNNIAFLNWDGGYATGDGINYKLAFDTNTVTYSDDAIVQWKNVNNAFSGAADLGFTRESAGLLKITNGGTGYGAIDAAGYSVSGTAGLTVTKTVVGSTGSNCTLTFTAGLLTATTCP